MSTKKLSTLKEFTFKQNSIHEDGNTNMSIMIKHLVNEFDEEGKKINSNVEAVELSNLESMSSFMVPLKALYKEGFSIEEERLSSILGVIFGFISYSKKTASPINVNVRVTDAKTGFFIEPFKLIIKDKYTDEVYFDDKIQGHSNESGFLSLKTNIGISCEATVSAPGYITEKSSLYFINSHNLSFRLLPEDSGV